MEPRQELLRQIPPMTELLKSELAAGWLKAHPQALVTDCLRQATARARQQVLENPEGHSGPGQLSAEAVLAQAGALLAQAVAPRLCEAINATGVILHTGLGRAVFPAGVVDAMLPELKGYSTLAVERETGERIERDELVEPILTELTGAEAATVVNNNAAATMLALAALAAQKEVIVSRGQLIEIGGSFRLPEVMVQSQARLVEVGATNRTHLKDYQNAIGPDTAAIMRVHPSNYRVVGFASEVPLKPLAELAHSRGLVLIDDLGAGALLGLEAFGLPHEPTVRESIEAGADLVLFSGDKLIGASQAGILVGRKDLVRKLRKHPLMRAMRVDKTCLMVLERTLHLFRDPERLRREHPTYRMLCASMESLRARAGRLQACLLKGASADTAPGVRPSSGAATSASQAVPEGSNVPASSRLAAPGDGRTPGAVSADGHPHTALSTMVEESVAYLGSGSLPTQALPSVVVSVSVPGLGASELARRLRMDEACVFGRIEGERVRLDMRTVTDEQVPAIAAALQRISSRK